MEPLYLFSGLFVLAGLLVIWLWRVLGRASQADWGGPWVNRLDGFNRLFCYRYQRL